MAYIGVQPTDTYLSIASQQITGTGSATYTLDYSVSNEEDVSVFVNNVRQNVSSYTVSGTSLTLGGTISASDECWVLFLGRTVGTKTPAVGSVTNDMLVGSIANAKLANSSVTVNGTSIALGASGNISAGITEADQWRLNTNFSATGGDDYFTTNLERIDTDSGGYFGTGMTESGGVFTFPSTGYWLVMYNFSVAYVDNLQAYINGNLDVSTDGGSTYSRGARGFTSIDYNTEGAPNSSSFCMILLDVTSTANIKVKFGGNAQATNATFRGQTDYNTTTMTFIRLGDT